MQDSWKVNRRLTVELGLRIHALPALDRPAGLWLLDLRLFASTLQLHADCNTAASSGTSAIPKFRSADSPRGRCSGNRASAWPTISAARARRFSAAVGDATTTTPASSPTAWTSPPEWSDRQPRHQCQRRTGAGQTSRHPELRRPGAPARPRWTVRTTGNRTPTATASPFRSGLPWSSLLEVAYVGNQSKDLPISSGARQQYQPGPVGAMLPAGTAAWIPTA